MEDRLQWACLVAAVLLLAPACASEDSPAQGGTIEESITEFSSEPDKESASFASISEALSTEPAGLREAALAHLDAEDPDVRYAALYALALTAEPGPSMEALRPYLQSEDISEQMLAAAGLVVEGDKAALPVLIGALDAPELLDFRFQPAWQFARLLLIEYTEEDRGLLGGPDYPAKAATSAQQRWMKWWAAEGATLRWDSDAGHFRSSR